MRAWSTIRTMTSPTERPASWSCGPTSRWHLPHEYFGAPEKTAEAWRDRWFHTGDRVVRQADGYFRFVDRLKDAIRRRGENISSFEVEQVLLSHAAVANAAAFPVRSPLAEDEVMAAVILHPGRTLNEAELIAFCEPRLPYFAVPRYLEFVSELPSTESGKVQKYKLSERGVTDKTWDREAAGGPRKRCTMTLSTMTFDTMTPAMPHIFPTVLHMLAAAGDAAPERVALRCGEERLTYREYISCVAGFAEALGGEVRGGRVALIMPNSIDAAVATFAILAAGAQAVPLNPAYTAHELRSILADAEPSAIVCDAALQDLIGSLAAELGIGRTIVVDAGSRLTRWASQRLSLPAFPEAHSLAILQYTGGTTGRSKGVNLTHRAVSTNVAQREALLPSGADENILIVTPTYHSYAIAMGLLLAPYCRGTLSILQRYRPEDALRTIEAHGITLFAGSPTLFVGLMAHEAFATTNFASLRLCFSGSSALPMETMRRWEAATGCTICEGYGQSEAGPVLTFNPRDGIRKQGSVGVPLPLTEVQIVDSETGTRPLGPNEPGEIRARGPQIMSGYRNRPEETAAALRDGWLYTGDIGAIDEDGYLFILDRKKDMAIVGGFNVYPREVEEALCAHPAVAEAAVIGVPDSYRGEVLIGYVVLRQPDASESGALTSYLAERLTRYKIPRDIRICAALPKTTVGKIDKVALKAAHRG